jgi:phage terminase small subunit
MTMSDDPDVRPSPPAPAPLTLREQRFVVEYIITGGNATEAARRAGYRNGPGLRITAHRVLTKANVQTAVADLRRTLLSKRVMTAEEVLEEQSRIGTSDIGALYDEHGNLRPIHTLSADVRRCIASTKTVIRNIAGGDGHTDTVVEVKFWPKGDALAFLGRYHGQDVQRVEVGGDLVAQLLAGRQRIAEARDRDGGDAE